MKSKSHVGKINRTFFIFLISILLSFNAVSQIPQANMTYSLPPIPPFPIPVYPSQIYSACFNDLTGLGALDILRDVVVDLEIKNFRQNSCNIVFTCPPGAFITGFYAIPPTLNITPAGPFPPTNTNLLNISSNRSPTPLNTSDVLSMAIRITGCDVFNSSSYPFTASFDCIGGGVAGTVTSSFPCTLPVPPTPGSADEMCIPIASPHVAFDNSNLPAGTSTLNDQYFLKYDEMYRFYKIVPTEGIVDYFTLDISPEPDIIIESIEAVDIAVPPYTVPLHSFSTTSQILFDNSIINTCVSGGGNRHPYMVTGSGDCIFIREKIKIIKSLGCADHFSNTNTVYHFAIHCDHSQGGPVCASNDETLNINSRVESPSLQVTLIDGTGSFPSISVCDDAPNEGIDYTVVVTNNLSPVHPGSGTAEITGIKFTINPNYFQFDGGISVGGLLLNSGTDYSYTSGTGEVVINVNSSWLNSSISSGPNSLTNVFTGANPSVINNTYTPTNSGPYVFLPEGHLFRVTLHKFHLTDCNTNHITNCDQSPFSLTSRGDPIFHISYNTMCEMNDVTHTSANATSANISDGWAATNNFTGNSDAYSPTTGVANGSPNYPGHAVISFTFKATGLAGIQPWNINDNSHTPSIIDCPDKRYVAYVHMPYFYTVPGMADIYEPNSATPLATLSVPSIPPSSNDFNDYIIDFTSVAGLSNPSSAKIVFDVVLTCPITPPPLPPDWESTRLSDIHVEFREVCDNANCSACYRTYGCADWYLYNHCGGDCISLIGTHSANYSFERNSFGWSSKAAYENALTTVPFVSDMSRSDFPPGLQAQDLQGGYDRDIVHISCSGNSGLLSSMNHFSFDLEYHPLSGTTNNFFVFQGSSPGNPLGGQLRIGVTPNNTTYTVPIAATQVVPLNFTNALHRYSQNSSYYTLQIQPDLSYVLPGGTTLGNFLRNNSCSFIFDGDFKITDNTSAIPEGTHTILIYTAFSYNNFVDQTLPGYYTHEEFSCDPNNTNFTYFKVTPIVDVYVDPDIGLLGPSWTNQSLGFPFAGNSCQVTYILYTNVSGGRTFDDDFPLEFRPVLRWPNQLKFRVPHDEYGLAQSQAGYATTYNSITQINGAFYDKFPGSSFFSCFGAGTASFVPTNANNIAISNLGTEDIIHVNTLNNVTDHWSGLSIPLALDKSQYTPKQGFALFLPRKCPFTDDPLSFDVTNDLNATINIDNSVTPDVDIITHAYSTDLNDHGLFDLCTPIPCSSATQIYNYHYDAASPQNLEHHELRMVTQPLSNIIGVSNPVTVQITLNHVGSGYKFPNLWIYFTSPDGATNFSLMPGVATTTISPLSGVNLSSPILFEISNSFYSTPTCTDQPITSGIDLNRSTVTALLTFDYPCNGGIGGASYDPVRIEAHFGNSCDEYHKLLNAIGNMSDFDGGYTPCLYQTEVITVLPQHSKLFLESILSSQNACNIEMDLIVSNSQRGEVSNSTLNISSLDGFAIDPNHSTVKLVGAANTRTLASLAPNMWNVNYAIDQLVPGSRLVFGTSAQYHLVYQPVCSGSGDKRFVIDLHGNSSCNPLPNPPDDFYPLFTHTFPGYAPPAGGCTGTASVENFINPSCTGNLDGSITVGPNSGGATFSWTPTGGTGATANNLGAGTYSCTIVYGSGCTVTLTQTLTDPSALSVSIDSHTDVLCNGATTGNAVVTSTGGTGTHHFLWSPLGGTTATATNLPAGNYTCTVTDDNGCTATASVTVIEPPALVADISFSTNISCFGGSNGSAIASVSGGTPGYLYSWSPSGGNTLTATNLIPGVYTFSVSDANGCIATATVNLSEPTDLALTPSSTTILCFSGHNGSASVAASGGAPGYSYLWSTGTTGSVIPGLSAGTYTVTVTDVNGCSASHAFVMNNGSPSCCGNANNSFPRFPDATNVTPGLSYNVNQNPFFPVEISGSVSLTGNTLYLAQGQVIIVHSGATLTLTNCHLLACAAMWRGILVENGGNIIVNGTTIEDAEYALRMTGPGNLQVGNSHFLDNFVGIKYDEGPHSGLFSVNETEFKGTGSMALPYPSQSTAAYVHLKPMSGIMINDFNVNVSSTGSRPNSFVNMISGIISLNSELYVTNATFKNIFADRNIPNDFSDYYASVADFEGCGIYAEDGSLSGISLNVQGFGQNSVNLNFDACQTGIKATSINMVVHDCTMGTSTNLPTEIGIQYQYGRWTTAEVGNNSIGAVQYGVNMEMNEGTPGLHVHDNIINIGAVTNAYTRNAGIRFSNFSQVNTSRSVISGNTVNMLGFARSGIEFDNFYAGTIEHNSIYFSSNATQKFGIHISNSDKGDISCNFINSTGTGYPDLNQAAIYTVSSGNVNYGCNTMNNTYSGFQFESGCPNTVMTGNTIKDHNIGLYLRGSTSVIGQQPSSLLYKLDGNIWDGTCSLWGAQGPPTFYLYFYNNTLPYNNFLPPTRYPTNWFQPSLSRQNFECGPDFRNGTSGIPGSGYCELSIFDPNAAERPGGEITGLDLDIARDSLRFADFNDQMMWELKRSLYEKFQFDPSLMDNDSAFIAFYDSMNNTPTGGFSLVDEKGRQMVTIDTIVLASVKRNNIEIDQNMILVGQYEEQLNSTSLTTTEKTTLLQNIQAVQEIIDNLRTSTSTLLTQYHNDLLVIANSAKALNNGIGTTETIEQNLRVVNDIYLSTIAVGNRNLSGSASLLLSIAQQCPVGGGHAVMQARALYAMLDRNMDYDDHLTCLQQGILYRLANREKTEDARYRIFPNPANESVTFKYSLKENTQGILNLINNMGEVVMTMKLDPKRNEILFDVSDLTNGIYSVTLTNENGIVFKSKLAIIK